MLKILLLFAAPMFGERLVNMETGNIVIEFMDGKVQFGDPFLEAEMKEAGIYIPPSKAEDFEREIVYLSDPMFEKAFLDVYYPLCIANSLYQWQN